MKPGASTEITSVLKHWVFAPAVIFIFFLYFFLLQNESKVSWICTRLKMVNLIFTFLTVYLFDINSFVIFLLVANFSISTQAYVTSFWLLALNASDNFANAQSIAVQNIVAYMYKFLDFYPIDRTHLICSID